MTPREEFSAYVMSSRGCQEFMSRATGHFYDLADRQGFRGARGICYDFRFGAPSPPSQPFTLCAFRSRARTPEGFAFCILAVFAPDAEWYIKRGNDMRASGTGSTVLLEPIHSFTIERLDWDWEVDLDSAVVVWAAR